MAKRSVVSRYQLNTNKLKKPLKIALVSDMHERYADDIFEKMKLEKPDLVLVAGDSFERYDNIRNKPYARSTLGFFSWIVLNITYYINEFFCLFTRFHNKSDDENTFRFFRNASRLAPVFVGLGNHEERLHDEDYDFFKRYGITVLENADTVFLNGDESLAIGSVTSLPDEKWLDSFAQRDGLKILICHHPEYYDILLKGKNIDLVVAGHAHGGQIRINGRGVFAPTQGLFPKYTKGLYNGNMIVSTGCANTVAIPRFGNPRELVVITLN